MPLSLHLPLPTVEADISLPPSKSISQRALLLKALSGSHDPIGQLSDCHDTRLLADALDGEPRELDLQGAGTAMRFLTAFLAQRPGQWILTGNERLRQRPIAPLVQALNRAGGQVQYIEKEGYPPLRICGRKLRGGHLRLDASQSSQYASALMMIAPHTQEGIVLQAEGKAVSRPYILMTAKLMKAFGVTLTLRHDSIHIPPQRYRPASLRVEADWSAASYWYEMLSIVGRGRLLLRGLGLRSPQGDSRVAALFRPLGVKTTYRDDGVCLTPCQPTHASCIRYDFTDHPDLAPALTVSCCMKGIPFVFTGMEHLKTKECDRLSALRCELRRIGYLVDEPTPGSLQWKGKRLPSDSHPLFDTHDDHRMAMAFAPVALSRPIRIDKEEVVRKSYPAFWQHLEQVQRQTKY